MTKSAAATARVRIAAEQAATVHRIESLTARLADILDGSELTTNDDEHDPEGSTIAFERAQVTSLIGDARQELEDLEAALRRVGDGSYGVCEKCGRAINPERLDALPAARRCIDCA
ncbi:MULTISPECIES: TraR/DksA C4-type zinc finger protein [unclassified Rhodococcus (in: high G+C Gram-positive bacteria)]|jgi:DnaK suppressor protein|uniref:TraR/DksA family transcriptional regulator n=1 Tax=unclassified Rhodococcus (in: high G+C Gram-positive bacteria) TaxID=192944 RepID=UPI000BD23849|nr:MULTISPECIES: TraR/DksA C4-type zinc finger protein [unclassified Rhodococcus (in: high G+C Gram-positive bacteria)]MBP1161350.1 RNA polymerase-binding transcription factor DksA [Rhodococcus sp. PvR099]PTR44516.1 TraR/DksA family transcriptional regulator [Rhodococcus sp. OK611]SNX89957.1 transcriptional regulator, TraR/DksA family [Rhodococcus sp. OK270]